MQSSCHFLPFSQNVKGATTPAAPIPKPNPVSMNYQSNPIKVVELVPLDFGVAEGGGASSLVQCVVEGNARLLVMYI